MEEENSSAEGEGLRMTNSAFPIIESTPESEITIIDDPENKEYYCIFCKRCMVDELEYGPLYRLRENDNVTVTHYFCMLFSAGLVQQGGDRQGILGFLSEDILKESRRATRLKCTYCHVSGASIGCNRPRCNVSFHFPCGLANDANFQFFKNYKAYCKTHSEIEVQEIPLEERECPICMSTIEPPERPIVGPCCKTSVFHRKCLQEHALNSGYFFKCPTCNSGEPFPDSARIQGIYVPAQDASWEREPDAYHELYQVYNRCDAEVCECPKGRTYGANKGSFLLARCQICGSAGVHRICGKLTTIANWSCKSCIKVTARAEKQKTETDLEILTEEATPSTAPSTSSSYDLQISELNTEKSLNVGQSSSSKRSNAKDASIKPKLPEVVPSTSKSKAIIIKEEKNRESGNSRRKLKAVIPETFVKPKPKTIEANSSSTKSKSSAAKSENKTVGLESNKSKRKLNEDETENMSRKKAKTSKISAPISKSKATVTSSDNKTEKASGSNRAKRTGVPDSFYWDDDDKVDVGFDLAKVLVQPSCSDYFPHSREVKKRLAERDDCFPDWRNYHLRVQLCDLFLDILDEEDAPPPIQRQRRPTFLKPVAPNTNKKPQNVPKDSGKSETVNGKATKSKSRKRGSSWSKGWLKRKKKPAASKSKSSKLPSVPENSKSSTNGVEHSQQKSAASPAVLEGIRRSRNSLLQLKAQSKIGDDPNSAINSENLETPNGQEKKKEGNLPKSSADIADSEPLMQNGIPNEKHGSTKSTSSESRSSRASTRSLSATTSSISLEVDKTVIKIEVDEESLQQNHEATGNSSGGLTSNGHSSLEIQVKQTAQGIAHSLLTMEDKNEANEQLKMLELKLPHLFKDKK